ncbi:MAG: hypothetical protein CM1200mP26_26620 [Acidimicrobiales bacterium]|nr:MAG: hypothetical protein CM1200mP26_26620 [Acidimicrobiales bacterium]
MPTGAHMMRLRAEQYAAAPRPSSATDAPVWGRRHTSRGSATGGGHHVHGLPDARVGHAAASLAETDHAADLGRIHAPTLVVVGEHDRVCPPSDLQFLADGIPGAVYAQVPNTGHLPNQERPDEFNRIVGDWLGGLRPDRLRGGQSKGGAPSSAPYRAMWPRPRRRRPVRPQGS